MMSAMADGLTLYTYEKEKSLTSLQTLSVKSRETGRA